MVDTPAFSFEIDDLPHEGAALLLIRDEAMQQAFAGLQAKILAGIRDAFRKGKDFVHGPIEHDGYPPGYPFAPFDITRPLKLSLEVKGGPAEPGQAWPSDWTVYRVESLSDAERARFCAGKADWRDPPMFVPGENCPDSMSVSDTARLEQFVRENDDG